MSLIKVINKRLERLSKTDNPQQGIYVGLKLTPESIVMMNDLLESSGVENPILPHDYHMTLFASYDSANGFIVDPNTIYSVEVVEVKYLGKALAMMVKDSSGKLLERHNYIKDYYNLTYTFDDFLPHISIKYDPLESDIELFKNLLVGKVFQVTGEYTEPFK